MQRGHRRQTTAGPVEKNRGHPIPSRPGGAQEGGRTSWAQSGTCTGPRSLAVCSQHAPSTDPGDHPNDQRLRSCPQTRVSKTPAAPAPAPRDKRYSERNPDEVTGCRVALPGSMGGLHTAEGKPVWYGDAKLAADLSLPKLRAHWRANDGEAPGRAGAEERLSPRLRLRHEVERARARRGHRPSWSNGCGRPAC